MKDHGVPRAAFRVRMDGRRRMASSATATDWSGWLVDGLRDKEIYEELRVHTRTGRPLGSPGFLEHLESLLDRVLRHKKVGRKPKRRRNEVAVPNGIKISLLGQPGRL